MPFDAGSAAHGLRLFGSRAARRLAPSARQSRRGALVVGILAAVALVSCVHANVKISEEVDVEMAHAIALAEQIAPRLASLEADFLASWQKTSNDQAMQATLLDQTRAAVANVLAGPELAAARDYVDESLDEARAQLAASRRRPGVHLVAAAAPAGSHSDVAMRIRTVRQRAENRDLLTYFCVSTVPATSAKFRLWPRSYPAGAKELVTSGEVPVYRGLYSYRLTPTLVPKDGAGTIECDRRITPNCPPIDLMTDSRRVLSCDLTVGACTRREGRVEGCPSSG